jgi:hypothetical protein
VSRNAREGRYFGKVNGRPKRVPLAMRAAHAQHRRRRFNVQFRLVRR